MIEPQVLLQAQANDDLVLQLPVNLKRNGLPVKLIDWSCLMFHEYSTRALVELMQIGKTPSGADDAEQHAAGHAAPTPIEDLCAGRGTREQRVRATPTRAQRGEERAGPWVGWS